MYILLVILKYNYNKSCTDSIYFVNKAASTLVTTTLLLLKGFSLTWCQQSPSTPSPLHCNSD